MPYSEKLSASKAEGLIYYFLLSTGEGRGGGGGNDSPTQINVMKSQKIKISKVQFLLKKRFLLVIFLTCLYSSTILLIYTQNAFLKLQNIFIGSQNNFYY